MSTGVQAAPMALARGPKRDVQRGLLETSSGRVLPIPPPRCSKTEVMLGPQLPPLVAAWNRVNS
eukprot:5686185-Heterocapsa_arctica.AAC.1